MSEGIHIPALAIRIGAVALALLTIKLVWSQVPEARRYLKMEAM